MCSFMYIKRSKLCKKLSLNRFLFKENILEEVHHLYAVVLFGSTPVTKRKLTGGPGGGGGRGAKTTKAARASSGIFILRFF
jgi:hypothetical protein